MVKYQENNCDNDFNIRTIEQILLDFINALDEVITTYNILNKIKDEDPRPNQLLFCHMINRFDSFINSFLYTIILSNSEKLKEYFQKNKNLDEKISFKEIINIEEIGIINWMKEESVGFLKQDINRKRHAQKVELFLDTIGMEYNKIYVSLTGPGKSSTGYFKKKPTLENKKNINHKTTSEKLIGYADILYEKRNAITHNKNFYPKNTIERLNQSWGLKISRKNVLVRRSTIKGVLRFYTSFCLELLKNKIINVAIKSNNSYKVQLNNLREINNVIPYLNNGNDTRFRNGGLDGRKVLLISAMPKDFNYIKYKKITGVSLTTVHRDLKKLLQEEFVFSTKRGVYNIKKY